MRFTHSLWFRSVLNVVKSAFRGPPPRRRRTRRLLTPVEALEDRCMLSFGSPVSLPAQSPTLVTADVNHDGRSDLVNVADNGEVSVYLAQKNGHFKSVFGGANDLESRAATMGDINGDGNTDLVVVDYPSGDPLSGGPKGVISILPGHGDGTFGTPTDLLFDSDRVSVAVGDVNGDGKLDIVTGGDQIGSGVNVLLNGDTLMQALNSGLGGYLPAQTYTSVLGLSIALGDVNGDGSLDIVTDGGILMNNGDGSGTFVDSPTGPIFNEFAIGSVPIALGDLNGDGYLDIVAGNDQGSATVSLALNNGDGTFGTIQTFAATQPDSLAVADFNGDGKLDIAVAGAELDVLLNNGDGTFAAAQNVGSAGWSLVVADFNGDGFADLAQLYGTGDIEVLFNNADWQGSRGHGKGHNK